MTRSNIEQASVRFPADLLKKVDALKDRDGVDRTSIINRAVRYWVEVDGKVISDNEYQKTIANLIAKIQELKQSQTEVVGANNTIAAEIKEYRTLLTEQQKTINRLIELLAKEEHQ